MVGEPLVVGALGAATAASVAAGLSLVLAALVAAVFAGFAVAVLFPGATHRFGRLLLVTPWLGL